MRAFLFGVGCAIIGAASGFAGGYAYSETHTAATKPTEPSIYCYDPDGPVHLNGDPQRKVCIPTR